MPQHASHDVKAGFHVCLGKPYVHLRGLQRGAKEGVIFSTYKSLTSRSKKSPATRLDQIVQWCGEDFDGLVIFDESHKAKGLAAGTGNSSQIGSAVLALQLRLPSARVVYCSATGAYLW